MDRTTVNNEANLQVTLEEIVSELNKQISNLNFELTASRLAIQKLQIALQNASENDKKIAPVKPKSNAETF
jgi:hypothetical protein